MRLRFIPFAESALPIVLTTLICLAWSTAAPQAATTNPGSTSNLAATSPVPLITQSVDESHVTLLRGNVHPLARPQFDLGAAPADLPMRRMLLVLKRGPEQDAALRRLIDDQQDRTSSSYRAWLTPQNFGARFGPADSDVQAITAWLRAHGFEVASTSKGRIAIEFSGTARQVQEAFHTEIHQYAANGQHHWANASDPSVPAALAPAVYGILSLHNFPRHTQSTLLGAPQGRIDAGAAPLPLFTFTPQKTTYYGLGPTDFATIYNLLPLWAAGIDGTGQTIAVVGESNINLADIRSFRSLFGLPANDPTIILNGPDPGLVADEPEAVLDVTWAGAVAKNASIDFVVSASTETAFGVDLSALYAVDNNLAPVLSESYGDCEANLGNAGNAFFHALWQQAAAQGITVVVSAGDGGSAGCDNFNAQSAAVAGLAVSGFASTPYNVAVGGTDFDQNSGTASTYWSATNDAGTGASALSYIPETTWNDSCAGLGAGACTGDSNFLNIISGSGGPSSCSTQDSSGACSSGYNKPDWQTGAGVPLDGVRDTPDVSLFASNGFNGSFYIICEEDALLVPVPCSLSKYSFLGFGGTSASAPAFAGIMALVNQKMAAKGLNARQGNANYVLYKLAAQQGASCDSSKPASGSACIFHDITKGNNSVPCFAGTPNCGPAPASGGFGVLTDPKNASSPAWTATPGYDMATGLGSVNAANLVNQWSSVTFRPSTTVLNSVTPLSVAHGQPVNIDVTVTPQSGTGTPTGVVALMAKPGGTDLGIDVFPLSSGIASGPTMLLPGGTYNVTAHYGGDGVFGGSDSAPIQVTVGKENSLTSVSVVSPLLSPSSSRTSVAYGSIFFLRGDVTNSSYRACAPDPQQTKVACPTGTVSFSSNGKPLDVPSYALNSLGYTEDQVSYSAFTSLGTYALQAQYSGDSSFNPSSDSLNVTVTQAPTILGPLLLPTSCCGSTTVFSGQSFQVLASVLTQSVLAAPTGALTILQNGAIPSGNVQLLPTAGASKGTQISAFASLGAQLTTSLDTPGTYTYTASYLGDANYLAALGTAPLVVTVVDTTFHIASPIPTMTIAAAGQTGSTTITLTGTDNFSGSVSLTCKLPATMTESVCPAVTANLSGSNSATAQVTVTTTAPHPLASNRPPSLGFYGVGALAGVALLLVPGRSRRRWPLMILLCCLTMFVGCGGGGGSSPSGSGGGNIDPGTSAGNYTVTVTATSLGITRTATFNVVVQ